MNQPASMPPGCQVLNGRIYRSVKLYNAGDGSEREQLRPVALSLKEAQETMADFWTATTGWIRNGRKPENEHFLTPIEAANSFEASAIQQGAPAPTPQE